MTPSGQPASGNGRSARRARWEHPFADVTQGEDGRVTVLHPALGTAESDLKQAAAANRILASLGEPRILQATDVERDKDGRLLLRAPQMDGLCAIGESVGQPARVSLAVHVLLEVCRALDAAHGLGVFHGALTPASVLVGPEPDRPTVKVTDFGLSHVFKAHTWGSGPAQWQPLAPERMMGQQAGPMTDVYLVGCLAYALLAGRPVFEGADVQTLLRCHAIEEPPKLHRFRLPQAIPRTLSRILLRCLVKETEERFDGPADLADALRTHMARAWREGAPSEGSGPVAHTGAKPKKLTTLADLRATLKAKDPASPIPPAPRTKPKPGPEPATEPVETSPKVKVAMKRPTPAPTTPKPPPAPQELARQVADAGAPMRTLPKPKGLGRPGAPGMKPTPSPPPPPTAKLAAGTGPHGVVQAVAKDEARVPANEALTEEAAPVGDGKPAPVDDEDADQSEVAVDEEDETAPAAAVRAADAEAVGGEEKTAAAGPRPVATKTGMGWAIPVGVGLVAAAIVGALLIVGDDPEPAAKEPTAVVANESGPTSQPDRAREAAQAKALARTPEPDPPPEVRDTTDPQAEVALDSPVGVPDDPPDGELEATPDAADEEPPDEEDPEEDPEEGDAGGDAAGSAQSSSASKGARASAYVKQADAARRSGDTARAISLYKRALQIRPGYANAASSLGFIYFNKGDHANAVRYGKLAVRYSPKNMEYRVKLGDTYYKMGRKADAKTHWQRAAELGSALAKKRLTKL